MIVCGLAKQLFVLIAFMASFAMLMLFGNYPHEFKNGERTFAGVSKKLREFPIIRGGTFNGGMFYISRSLISI